MDKLDNLLKEKKELEAYIRSWVVSAEKKYNVKSISVGFEYTDTLKPRIWDVNINVEL